MRLEPLTDEEQQSIQKEKVKDPSYEAAENLKKMGEARARIMPVKMPEAPKGFMQRISDTYSQGAAGISRLKEILANLAK